MYYWLVSDAKIGRVKSIMRAQKGNVLSQDLLHIICVSSGNLNADIGMMLAALLEVPLEYSVQR